MYLMPPNAPNPFHFSGAFFSNKNKCHLTESLMMMVDDIVVYIKRTESMRVINKSSENCISV